MTVLHNNILINKHSKDFTPFLFNLFTGRRRLIKNNEVRHVRSMLEKDSSSYFTDAEKTLCDTLLAEKQLLTDEERILQEI